MVLVTSTSKSHLTSSSDLEEGEIEQQPQQLHSTQNKLWSGTHCYIRNERFLGVSNHRKWMSCRCAASVKTGTLVTGAVASKDVDDTKHAKDARDSRCEVVSRGTVFVLTDIGLCGCRLRIKEVAGEWTVVVGKAPFLATNANLSRYSTLSSNTLKPHVYVLVAGGSICRLIVEKNGGEWLAVVGEIKSRHPASKAPTTTHNNISTKPAQRVHNPLPPIPPLLRPRHATPPLPVIHMSANASTKLKKTKAGGV